MANYDSMKKLAKNLRVEIEEKYSREFIHSELLKFYKSKLSNH
jgi:hypothetical protein